MISSIAVAENRFTEQFKKVLERGGGPLAKIRSGAFTAFGELGFPSQKNEDWKYTNIEKIAKADWAIAESLAETEVPDGGMLDLLRRFEYQRNGFAALNLAFAELFVIRIPAETVVEEPIEHIFGSRPGTAIFPHILMIAESGSKATFVERYEGEGFTNSAVQVIVEPNANLTHFRVQKDSADAFNVGTTEVEVGRGAYYNSTNINLGAALSRHDIDLKFLAEGGEAHVDGLYMLNDSQHHDTHSVIDHTVPNCVSHQNYKGVLNDHSRAVFNGKVFVRLNASGTDANQSNKNLLLSNDARVDTKPQLEIFNDDVKCSHGATVGQLEDEELFYLLTRGLPETLARNLLTYGFAEEIINKISIESIKADLDAAVLNRLGTTI